MSEKHTTVITSDEPVKVMVDEAGGRWFRLFCSLVESGAWSRLSDSACRVYVVLAKHCGAQWIAWPSLPTLAQLSGKSRRQVRRAVLELESEGLIRRRVGGGRCSTLYQLFDVPQTPSLPFPVREKGAGSRVSPLGGHGRPRSRVTGDPRTRPIEQDSLNKQAVAAVSALVGLGVTEAAARGAVETFGADKVSAAVASARFRQGVRNRAGLCLALLRRGEVPAPPRSPAQEATALSEFRRREAEASKRAAEAFYGVRAGQGATGPLGA